LHQAVSEGVEGALNAACDALSMVRGLDNRLAVDQAAVALQRLATVGGM